MVILKILAKNLSYYGKFYIYLVDMHVLEGSAMVKYPKSWLYKRIYIHFLNRYKWHLYDTSSIPHEHIHSLIVDKFDPVDRGLKRPYNLTNIYNRIRLVNQYIELFDDNHSNAEIDIHLLLKNFF